MGPVLLLQSRSQRFLSISGDSFYLCGHTRYDKNFSFFSLFLSMPSVHVPRQQFVDLPYLFLEQQLRKAIHHVPILRSHTSLSCVSSFFYCHLFHTIFSSRFLIFEWPLVVLLTMELAMHPIIQNLHHPAQFILRLKMWVGSIDCKWFCWESMVCYYC